ncbi:MAG: NAD(P)H-dependent oxidoreductase [Ignavibacteriae bacterium]|nr:NAD(P)H-dependent oxidoreductase [Ignavibacteriota bacterium]
MINVAIINGSAQKRNYVGFCINCIKKVFAKNENFIITEISLKDFNLPFPGEQIENDDSPKLRKLLKSADAYILGTPEYNGSFSAKLKLMFENASYPSEMKNKPVSIFGIASGSIGAIKSLEHLRSVCAHIGGFVLPRAVSIANVEDKFDENGNCNDDEIVKEFKNLSKSFIQFCETTISKL